MEEFIQFSAKTKNEAITKACIELGVSSDQLEIEVVSEGSSGFFEEFRQQTGIVYNGPKLTPFTRYLATLEITDNYPV